MSLRNHLKGICFSFLMAGLLFSGENLLAQSAKTLRTEALNNLENYRANPSKLEDLKQAQTKIDKALADKEQATDSKTWRYKGSIYTAIADNDKLRAQYENPALIAYEAWLNALQLEESKLAEKGKSTSKISARTEFKEGFEAVATSLYNSAVEIINGRGEEGYEQAYALFMAILDMPKKAKTIFSDKAPHYRFKELDVKRFAGISALNIGKMEEGEALLRPLLQQSAIEDKTKADIYNYLAKSAMDNQQPTKARDFIAEGRKKYPKDQGLLRTEISLAIAERRLHEVEPQLELAVKENPSDAELIFVLGSLNDEIFREKIRPAERRASMSAEYEKEGLVRYQKAMDYYIMALKANPKHLSSLYSLGVLQVNYANYGYKKQDAEPKHQRWVQLSDDAIAKALEYLHQAENIAPSDKLVLEALQKLYIIKGDTAKAQQYQSKLK